MTREALLSAVARASHWRYALSGPHGDKMRLNVGWANTNMEQRNVDMYHCIMHNQFLVRQNDIIDISSVLRPLQHHDHLTL